MIRSKKIQTLEEIGLKGILKIIRPHVDEGKLVQMGCIEAKKIKWLGWWICELAISNKEATWWIGARNEEPKDWIEATAISCIQEWVKTKPFKQ
jgi:hypothetical protein